MTSSQTDLYLELIGSSFQRADGEGLQSLQRGHLEHIPYSTLSLWTEPEVPPLEPEALFERIVLRRRGGYCFELNGLFAELLRSLGYQVTEYFGRWHFGETDPVPMRRHRILRVECSDGVFLADAGIGGQGPCTPLEFVFDKPQLRGGRHYMLSCDQVLGIVVKTETPEGFVPFYSFIEDPHFPQDFVYPHYYYSTRSDSRFRQRFYMHRQTDNTQYFIRHPEEPDALRTFCIKDRGQEITNQEIRSREQLWQIVTDNFDISCSPEELPGPQVIH